MSHHYLESRGPEVPLTAGQRMRQLIAYVKKQKKMPKPPVGARLLNKEIGAALLPIKNSRVSAATSCFSIEEMWFLFRAAKKLGFKPRWKK